MTTLYLHERYSHEEVTEEIKLCFFSKENYSLLHALAIQAIPSLESMALVDSFSLEKNLTYGPKSQPYLYQIITCFFFPFLRFALQLSCYRSRSF
jgi:hypothetical protein